MRLLIGPPGSGKTTQVLEEFVAASRSAAARLVVPTATMAEHLRHELARRGRHVRPSSITTMAGLVSELLPRARIAGSPELALVVEFALERQPGLFSPLRDTPGLAPALAAALEELANAGVSALELESFDRLGAARPHPDLVRLYVAVEEELRAAGLSLRAQALGEASRRIAAQPPPFSAVWFDGFFLFSSAELEFLCALAAVARLTVTLPEWEGARPATDRLRRQGARVEQLQVRRPRPRTVLVRAASRDHEVEEAVLRLIEEHERGRSWREMGIVVRNEDQYLAPLERALLRAGIPARAYFGRALWREPVCLLVRRFVDAVSSGWEGEAVLRLLRTPASLAASALRSGGAWSALVARLPFAGLDGLRRAHPQLACFLDPFSDWPELQLSPKQWAVRLRELARLLEPPPASAALGEDELRAFRLHAAAFREILSIAETAAGLLPVDPLPLARFWPFVEAALREARIYAEDGRRDVVHLLDVEESRQWELPVVFVCGLLEGEFPRRIPPDPVLPDALRQALASLGIGIRTRAQREAEESFLYEIACTRATEKLFLSWPARSEKGDEQLRSFALDQAEAEGAPVREARRFAMRPLNAPALPARAVSLASDDQLAALRQVHSRLSATAIESFLQCPFQFFAAHTLQLKEPAKFPDDRLDALFLGTLAHAILAEWPRRGGDIGIITEEMWDRETRRQGIRAGHAALLAREAMKRNLRLYAEKSQSAPDARIELERKLELPLAGVQVQGRADRVDFSSDGRCVVFDFKYSSSSGAYLYSRRVAAGLSVQGGLYAEALRKENYHPQAIWIVLLKNELKLVGADNPEVAEEQMQQAVHVATKAIEEIFAGRIEVSPADTDQCSWCSFRDACRLNETAPAVLAAGS
jgi:ATP-dependent helicase/DNAse subunit B